MAQAKALMAKRDLDLLAKEIQAYTAQVNAHESQGRVAKMKADSTANFMKIAQEGHHFALDKAHSAVERVFDEQEKSDDGQQLMPDLSNEIKQLREVIHQYLQPGQSQPDSAQPPMLQPPPDLANVAPMPDQAGQLQPQ